MRYVVIESESKIYPCGTSSFYVLNTNNISTLEQYMVGQTKVKGSNKRELEVRERKKEKCVFICFSTFAFVEFTMAHHYNRNGTMFSYEYLHIWCRVAQISFFSSSKASKHDYVEVQFKCLVQEVCVCAVRRWAWNWKHTANNNMCNEVTQYVECLLDLFWVFFAFWARTAISITSCYN